MSAANPAYKRFLALRNFLFWRGPPRLGEDHSKASRDQHNDELSNVSTMDLNATVDSEKMIDRVLVDRMRVALEIAHHGKATYLYAVPVHEKQNGATVWYGRVYLFEIKHQGTTKNVYTWFQEATEGPKRFCVVFKEGVIDSPAAAVRFELGLKAQQ